MRRNTRHYAAIETPSLSPPYRFVQARRHVYHASRDAAERAAVRAGRRHLACQRAFVWPCDCASAMHDGDWSRIFTIAL